MLEKQNEVVENYYLLNFDSLCKKIGRQAGSIHNAEDIVQEAFCRALKYWDSYTGDDKGIAAWFNTILNRCLKDFKSDERRGGAVVTTMNELPEIASGEGDLDNHILSNEMVKVIESKSSPTKDILYLYFVKQNTSSEVGQILNQTTHNVKQVIWRFKREIRDGEDAGVRHRGGRT